MDNTDQFGGWANQDTYDVAIALSTRKYGPDWREWYKLNEGMSVKVMLKQFCDHVKLPYSESVNWDELGDEFNQRKGV